MGRTSQQVLQLQGLWRHARAMGVHGGVCFRTHLLSRGQKLATAD